MDEARFTECMNIQKETARNARQTTTYMGADATVYEQLPVDMTSEFVGYDKLTYKSKITAITTELGEGKIRSLFLLTQYQREHRRLL